MSCTYPSDRPCTGCPLCDPEMARVLEMSINDVPGYARWLTQRTEAAMRHLQRHAVAGEPRRSPLVLRTHVFGSTIAPKNADFKTTDNAHGVPAAPSLLVRRTPLTPKAKASTT